MDEIDRLRDKHVLVTGANGIVGRRLIIKLRSEGAQVTCVSRNVSGGKEASPDVTWLEGDLEKKIEFPRAEVFIHSAPVWLLPKHMDNLSSKGVQRFLAFSSTSALTKQHSSDTKDRALSERLQAAEQMIKTKCRSLGLPYTLLRPTMIYGYGEDQNISKIARFIRRFKVFFIAGKGSGLRQPVHVDDLVSASIAALTTDTTKNKSYELPGGEILTYKEMVTRIFQGLGVRPRIFSLPVLMYQLLLQLLSLVPGNFSYSGGMAGRMNEDLSFSYTAAAADMGYAPQNFLSEPARDLIEVAR